MDKSHSTNPEVSGTDAPNSATDARVRLVAAARQSWVNRLIDMSRRNNLLYFRHLKSGTIDLSSADLTHLDSLLSGSPVSISRLLQGAEEDAHARDARFVNIARRAMANLEEKGLQTLFLGMGMATWPAPDGGRDVESPVLLLPVALEAKGTAGQSFHISRAGDPQINLVLLHALKVEHGLIIEPDELLAHLSDADENESLDPEPFFAELSRLAAEIKGFGIRQSFVLGNFAFQKMAMVKDLQELGNQLTEHDVVAAMAGDVAAKNAVITAQKDFDPKEIDRTPPESEFMVLDADSSQQCAIAGIGAGQTAVIHGPPGTGKSQTIVNLIASLAAAGKRVLFVAEKRAALEVVMQRLKAVGLDHLAIDLHGASISPKKVMQQIERTLLRVRSSPPVECGPLHEKLVERRSRLNAHVERIHRLREPVRESLFNLQGSLLRLSRTLSSTTRWRGAELAKITTAAATQIRDGLKEAAGLPTLFLRSDLSPWTGAVLPDGRAVQDISELLALDIRETWPEWVESLKTIVNETHLQIPESISAGQRMCNLVASVRDTLQLYREDVYQRDLPALSKALSGASTGILATFWAWCTNPAYRKARREILELRGAGKVSAKDLLNELNKAIRDREQWKTSAEEGSLPRGLRDPELHARVAAKFSHSLDVWCRVFPNRDLALSTLLQFDTFLKRLDEDKSTPQLIPKLSMVEKKLADFGAANLVQEIRQQQPPPSLWPGMFEYAWYASVIDAASRTDVEVLGFNGVIHNGFVNDFLMADEQRIEVAADRVRRSHAVHAVTAMNNYPAEEHLIRQEAQKSRKHIPLRRMFRETANVLTAVCPCWMASPLSVSQLLDGGKRHFDFVIFDEASQVLPEDAIPAILRGTYLIVAGDEHQLPPTTFFAADEDIPEDEDSATEGFESLLNIAIPFARNFYLNWHYRSRDEALISFSNRRIYDNRLVTFPGPGGAAAVKHVLVAQSLGIDGQEESSAAEVREVVRLVIDHARRKPEKTLGVITMGISHMNRVQAALDQALGEHRELASFFDASRAERFFVKNLERVQGDERDSIIISVGYGKNRAGDLPLRFGPLMPESGRRRLNVAVTRARESVTLVSSFSHLDIDLSRVRKGSGTELLRDYILYASTNGKRLSEVEITGEAPNSFEQEIFDVLTSQGLKLIHQVGASQYRIDLVAEHPRKPGRFVLAIECDGASYHSSYTARDRDRLRQQQLENLGWRFHRIWSTDWFMRRAQEVDRTLAAFKDAVEYADKLDDGVPDPFTGSFPPASENQQTNGSNEVRLERSQRPGIPLKTSISQYTRQELKQLVQWIKSDGLLRTDEEIVSEMVLLLGFKRRGVRIENAILDALR